MDWTSNDNVNFQEQTAASAANGAARYEIYADRAADELEDSTEYSDDNISYGDASF